MGVVFSVFLGRILKGGNFPPENFGAGGKIPPPEKKAGDDPAHGGGVESTFVPFNVSKYNVAPFDFCDVSEMLKYGFAI